MRRPETDTCFEEDTVEQQLVEGGTVEQQLVEGGTIEQQLVEEDTVEQQFVEADTHRHFEESVEQVPFVATGSPFGKDKHPGKRGPHHYSMAEAQQTHMAL